MPRKMARSGWPTAVRARGMVATVGTARRSCGMAGKAQIFTSVRSSSGECRFRRDPLCDECRLKRRKRSCSRRYRGSFRSFPYFF
jgi:hypothetical protein